MDVTTWQALRCIVAVGGGSDEVQPEFWLNPDNEWALNAMGLTVVQRQGADGELCRLLVPVDLPDEDIDEAAGRSHAAMQSVQRDADHGLGGDFDPSD